MINPFSLLKHLDVITNSSKVGEWFVSPAIANIWPLPTHKAGSNIL
jgi:hypothetical protein